MDNGTTGRLAQGLRSIAIVGHATGYLFAELRGYCRTALLGRRLLPVIRTFDRRRRGMRIARAIDSMPQLRRQLVPTVRSRVERGQFSTGVDQPTQGVSWVNVQPGLADQTTPLSSLTLSLIRALVAGSRPHRADSKPNAWSNFLAGRGRYPLVKVPHDHGQRQDRPASSPQFRPRCSHRRQRSKRPRAGISPCPLRSTALMECPPVASSP